MDARTQTDWITDQAQELEYEVTGRVVTRIAPDGAGYGDIKTFGLQEKFREALTTAFQMGAAKWTQDLPTEEGSYGIFTSSAEVVQIEYHSDFKELGCYTYNGWQPITDFVDAWWCKIELPPKPEGAR